MNKIRVVLHGAGLSCLERIHGTRFLLSAVLIFVLEYIGCRNIFRILQEFDVKITPWLAPHIFSTRVFITYYGFILCYMFSDIPFMSKNELPRILREGRFAWCMGKLITISMQSFVITLLSMLYPVLIFLKDMTWTGEWGSCIYTLAYNMRIAVDYGIRIYPETQILEHYSPGFAMVTCFLFVWGITSLIGYMMFAVSLLFGRGLALFWGLLLGNLQLSVEQLPSVMWLYYVSPLTWMSFSCQGEVSFGISSYPSRAYCISMILLLGGLSIIVVLFRTHKMEFQWNKEE